MRTTTTLTALAALTSLASAHFNLNYPAARGFDEDNLGNFPCGSQDTVSSNRTLWPLSGGSIALTMGHIEANVEVLIGFGNSVGSAFNTVLRQTFTEQGLGKFCMTGLNIPAGMTITEGMNATIQVVTNGDPDGGLYNCADITFSAGAAPASGVCVNGTGVTASTATISGSPNVTSASTTTSSGAAASTTKAGAAVAVAANVGGLIMVGLVALVAVL